MQIIHKNKESLMMLYIIVNFLNIPYVSLDTMKVCEEDIDKFTVDNSYFRAENDEFI